MQVKLTTTTKRENSTYIPTFSITLQCRLKAPSSVMNPTLMFDRENVGNNYNYAYIPEFDRYYFVTNIVYAGALVEYDLRCDVLASFKATIGASSQYVLRAASEYDESLVDTLYPLTTTKSVETESKALGYSYDLLDVNEPGVYCVGILNNGTTQYYYMGRAAFGSFGNQIVSDTYVEQLVGAVALAANPYLKVVADPYQFISSITWIPVTPSITGLANPSTLSVGYGTVDMTDLFCYRVKDPVITNSISFTVKDHPLAVSRGAYLNVNPYTQITLIIPGFGAVDISPVDVKDFDVIKVDYEIDVRTGTSTVTIYAYNNLTTQKNFLTRLHGKLGATVQVSQVVSGGAGLPGIVGSALGLAGGIATGDISATMGGLQGVGNIAQSYIPTVRTLGNTSGVDGIDNHAICQYTWFSPAAEDLSQHGRPLCKVKQISTLSGYILCESGTEVQISGTADEQRQINDYLRGGFYYE